MALAANTAVSIRNRNGETRLSGVILTSQVMYHHALAVRTAAGLVKVAANETTTHFLGLVEIDNPDNATAGITGDGTLRVEMISNVDVLLPTITAITVGDMGSKAYAVDDQTATTEATLGPEIGTFIEFVATNSAWVRLGAANLVVAS
jgi:hypothetical protein